MGQERRQHSRTFENRDGLVETRISFSRASAASGGPATTSRPPAGMVRAWQHLLATDTATTMPRGPSANIHLVPAPSQRTLPHIRFLFPSFLQTSLLSLFSWCYISQIGQNHDESPECPAEAAATPDKLPLVKQLPRMVGGRDKGQSVVHC